VSVKVKGAIIIIFVHCHTHDKNDLPKTLILSRSLIKHLLFPHYINCMYKNPSSRMKMTIFTSDRKNVEGGSRAAVVCPASVQESAAMGDGNKRLNVGHAAHRAVLKGSKRIALFECRSLGVTGHRVSLCLCAASRISPLWILCIVNAIFSANLHSLS
jgi:hypothetical protein